MNAANSGVVQVPTITGSEQAQPLVAPEQIIQKDGYLYIYVSNESAQRVFFDNLVIHHNKGHLLEEDQYYPFGLKMAGISDQALPVVPNNYLYNGKELLQNEFSDGTGLDWYSYGMREYDPQLTRFPQLDPLTDEFPTLTPYQYAGNDPVANIDLDGLESVGVIGGLADGSAPIINSFIEGGIFVMAAAKPVTASAKVVKGLSLASKIERVASPALHFLQSAGGAIADATRQVGNSVGAGWNNFNNAPFWQTGVGRAVNAGGTWFDETINPVYLLFNGINSQFTGKDYLTGNPVSHTEGAADILMAAPVSDVAKVADIGAEAVERAFVDVGEETSEKLTTKGANNVADEAFVHITTPAGAKNILSKGLNPEISGFVTKWKYVKDVTNPSDFNTMLYRQKLWPQTVGKFDNGFNILQIDAKPTFFSPRTNWVNGIPQYKFNSFVDKSLITTVK